GKDTPLVSVLKDSFGDPESVRLRQAWVLTYVRPRALQRFAAALPFLYLRPGTHGSKASGPPTAVLDLAAADRQVWSSLLGAILQSEFFDVRGVEWRAPSRGYRGNAAEYRNTEVA